MEGLGFKSKFRRTNHYNGVGEGAFMIRAALWCILY